MAPSVGESYVKRGFSLYKHARLLGNGETCSDNDYYDCGDIVLEDEN